VIATPNFGRFAMTGEDAGYKGCDCHDMFSTCLAMTGEGYKGWLKGSHREKPESL